MASTRSDSFIAPDVSADKSKATLKSQARLYAEKEVNGPSTKNHHGLKSKWPVALDLYGSNLPCRLEGEVGDLVVLGEIPKEIDGTFYRVMVDPWAPPCEGNVPLDGDGNMSAFRFHNGRVDMKTKYVETQRYLLERRAGKSLFGLYRNPWSHHPCVRAAIDSTANTNLVYWAGRLLALKESALPYSVNPQTMETQGYDPFGQLKSKTFTAHPKIDPFTNELVVHGYEATGIASNDIVTYEIDEMGKVKNVFWYKQPFEENHPGLIHDCAITPNWLVLFVWPFEADVERMKKGGQHWAYCYERKATFIVIPRNANDPPAASGWKKGEVRHYEWKNCMAIHTAGAWEDANGTVYVESSRVHDNAFPFFPSTTGQTPASDTKADYVRWEFDLTKAAGTYLPDPEVILDIPAEFPRIDERFMSHAYSVVWMNVFISTNSPSGQPNDFKGLNGLAQHHHDTGKTQYFHAGFESLIQEPIFIPRSKTAPEGDGWVMALVERLVENRCDVVVLDTKQFERPVAIVQLPFHMKAQVHGNWVGAEQVGGYRSLVKEVGGVEILRRGALEPL